MQKATVLIAGGFLEQARELASGALLLFQQVNDAAEYPGGEADAEETPALMAAAAARPSQVVQAKPEADFDMLRKQVRGTVVDIVGVDDLDDDTPLMQTGLTSQSAVLLRNALTKEIGGASLPFTMMFDFPSVAALTDYFMERS